ncbi:hypothetical protein SNR37_002133 [Agarivorans aestuarii]|uniref:Uncharacterized protein n=1 Tax=Agarivorans aestuarii TaxID=1563703 RepID=A0ABU7FZX2_9ALTE|nr:hypothetical protein [Agarivorans aestuarii]MEE1672723.1 hypothetical protein [Agarivorans aestuarii]
MKTYGLVLSLTSTFIAGYLVAVIYHPKPSSNAFYHQDPKTNLVTLSNTANSSSNKTDTSAKQSHFDATLANNPASQQELTQAINTPVNVALSNKVQNEAEPSKAAQFDALKQAIQTDPTSLASSIDQLAQLKVDDPDFDLLLSAIQSSANPNTNQALLGLAEEYAMLSDVQSQQKFLSLLSSTSEVESQLLVQGLVDLATQQQSDAYTRVEALALLKPYQISEAEREQITGELEQQVLAASADEAEVLLSQLMRFSHNQQRSDIASDMLYNSSEPTKLAILNNINSGSIPAADELKTKLLAMASDQQGALWFEAQQTLLSSFDLSQQEYSQLNSN